MRHVFTLNTVPEYLAVPSAESRPGWKTIVLGFIAAGFGKDCRRYAGFVTRLHAPQRNLQDVALVETYMPEIPIDNSGTEW